LSERLLQRLDTLGSEPQIIVDLGCDSALRLAGLRQRYPQAVIAGIGWSVTNLPGTGRASYGQVDPSANPAAVNPGVLGDLGDKLRGWLSDHDARRGASWKKSREFLLTSSPLQLPLASETVDLVIASQVLPWCPNPAALFSETHRVLKSEGAFFWSSAGPDTLKEYTELWQSIDSYPHVWGLRDMHDLGDEMLRCGFDSPVLDRENLTLQYPGVGALTTELQANGLANITAGRRRGLMGRDVTERLESLSGKKRFDVTFELVQGHGWKKPLRSQQKTNDLNEVTIPADSIKKRIFNQQRINLPDEPLLAI